MSMLIAPVDFLPSLRDSADISGNQSRSDDEDASPTMTPPPLFHFPPATAPPVVVPPPQKAAKIRTDTTASGDFHKTPPSFVSTFPEISFQHKAVQKRGAVGGGEMVAVKPDGQDKKTVMQRLDLYPLQLTDYVFGKKLGMGAFGKVKAATHVHTDIQVAVKIMNHAKVKKQNMAKKVMREIHLLEKCAHPNVMRMFEMINTPTDMVSRRAERTRRSRAPPVSSSPLLWLSPTPRRRPAAFQFVVCEFVPGGELFEFIVERGRVDEGESRRLFRQLLAGVEYLHSIRICHRDLKVTRDTSTGTSR